MALALLWGRQAKTHVAQRLAEISLREARKLLAQGSILICNASAAVKLIGWRKQTPFWACSIAGSSIVGSRSTVPCVEGYTDQLTGHGMSHADPDKSHCHLHPRRVRGVTTTHDATGSIGSICHHGLGGVSRVIPSVSHLRLIWSA